IVKYLPEQNGIVKLSNNCTKPILSFSSSAQPLLLLSTVGRKKCSGLSPDIKQVKHMSFLSCFDQSQDGKTTRSIYYKRFLLMLDQSQSGKTVMMLLSTLLMDFVKLFTTSNTRSVIL